MKHRIVMIGPDGSKITTRPEEEIHSGDDKHQELFMSDIYPTE